MKHLFILHNSLPESVLYSKVCYTYFLYTGDSATTTALYLHLYQYVCAWYNGVCIYIFVYVIKPTNRVYFVLGVLLYISPVNGLFYNRVFLTHAFVLLCLLILYHCLLWYVCVIHMIYSLFVIHLSKRVMYISWFIISLFSSLLIYIQNNWLSPISLDSTFSCCVHRNTYICY